MNIVRGTKLVAALAPWSANVNFALFQKQGDVVAYGTKVEMFAPEKDEYGKEIEPLFSLGRDEVQELMDNLWQIGFRPSEGTGSAGALSATQKHLEDMRKIAFDLLEKK